MKVGTFTEYRDGNIIFTTGDNTVSSVGAKRSITTQVPDEIFDIIMYGKYDKAIKQIRDFYRREFIKAFTEE